MTQGLLGVFNVIIIIIIIIITTLICHQFIFIIITGFRGDKKRGKYYHSQNNTIITNTINNGNEDSNANANTNANATAFADTNADAHPDVITIGNEDFCRDDNMTTDITYDDTEDDLFFGDIKKTPSNNIDVEKIVTQVL